MRYAEHESGRRLRLRFWFFGWWGDLFAPTDVGDCWAYAKVRPRWYWWWRRVRLFLLTVGNLGLRTAWDVSAVARGVSVWRVKGATR